MMSCTDGWLTTSQTREGVGREEGYLSRLPLSALHIHLCRLRTQRLLQCQRGETGEGVGLVCSWHFLSII